MASLVDSAVKNPPAMQEMRVQSLGWDNPLEKEMATPLQYSCLENSRTEEPGGLQSTESQSLDRTEQLKNNMASDVAAGVLVFVNLVQNLLQRCMHAAVFSPSYLFVFYFLRRRLSR